MNHDEELRNLGIALKILLYSYDYEISQIMDAKHRTGLVQEFDKAKHFMLKMNSVFKIYPSICSMSYSVSIFFSEVLAYCSGN